MRTAKLCLSLVVGLVAGALTLPAQAASVVFSGAQGFYQASANSMEEARGEALRLCQLRDSHCTERLACQSAGYGAVAAAYNGSVLDAWGASCGRSDRREAQLEALGYCKKSAVTAACRLTSTWLD